VPFQKREKGEIVRIMQKILKKYFEKNKNKIAKFRHEITCFAQTISSAL